MAKFKFEGLNEYVAQLEKLSSHAEGQIKAAVYDGAKIVADTIKSALQTIPTRSEDMHYEGKVPGPTAEEKRSLIAGFGLSRMKTEKGYVNTKAGFEGYSTHTTKSYPSGVPNAVIAQSIESGTSWMQKRPVIRQATQRAKAAAEIAMKTKMEQEIRNITH